MSLLKVGNEGIRLSSFAVCITHEKSRTYCPQTEVWGYINEVRLRGLVEFNNFNPPFTSFEGKLWYVLFI
ncbi:MAG TPA: hypothetical protein V6C95_03050 [Coleofasciculaceae cyanobacterium]